MRPSCEQVLSGASSTLTNGVAVDVSSITDISIQTVSTGTPVGTLKVQVSDDLPNQCTTGSSGKLVPTNWTDLANATASISSAGTAIIAKTGVCYQWLRSVFTPTGGVAQTIVLVGDVSGSLNSTYFLLSDEADTHKYYVWFNINSAGVDPLIAGRTAVPITGATNASAATLGAAVATAVAALNSSNSFTAAGTTTVTVTNKVVGPVTPMVDGAAPTGFTFAVTVGSGVVSANMKSIGF